MTGLCLGIALLAGFASAAGVFFRGDGATAAAVSLRGEHTTYATTGVYRYNAERLVAEGVGWDIVTLFVAVPALLGALPFLARGSLRGRLFAAGLLGYLFYQYLMYALMWAFGPLFLVFVALYSASLVGVVWIASTIPLAELAAGASERFPRRGMATFSLAMAALLVLMWTQRIATGLSGQLQGLLHGQPTLVVQALDLGLIVPLAVFTGVALLQRRPAGYLLSSLFVVKGFTMAVAIAAMLLSAWAVEGALEVVPLAIFTAAAVVALLLGAGIFGAVAEPAMRAGGPTERSRRAASPGPVAPPARHVGAPAPG
ncbi:uncharacterized protein SOCE26_097590 [Sorangium cellulosum]|uniref:Uncharacterized protein n=2 Tax=Sorangium cellulosum TaxID=56 RepID=A0A2L0F9F4_SORCE|nr:uncharacterized protein SOCE26_097590 [Sorangium cellulosum]